MRRQELVSLEVADLDFPHKQARVRTEWARSYARPFDDRWLPKDERREEAGGIGRDGFELLAAVFSEEDAPAWLKVLPAVETMRMVWLQNYLLTPGGVRWRTKEDGMPPTAKRLTSPTDPEARGARRGEISWGGYKVHLTETCDEGSAAPRIVQGCTTVGYVRGKHRIGYRMF